MKDIRTWFRRLTVENRSFTQRFFFAAFIDLAFAFSVFAFIPYEMFYSNMAEFRFAISDFWMPLAVFGIVYAAIFLVHLCLKGLLYDLYTAFVFGGMMACYVQSMFLNGVMQKLDETGMTWDAQTRIVNLLIWIAIVLLPVVVRFICKKQWKTFFSVGSAMVLGAQMTALVTLILTTPLPPPTERWITDKGLYEVSGKKNVIVFCIDRFDGKYVDQTLEKYPNAFDNMDGFTYYPNAVGQYAYTHIAVPYLLTGNHIAEYNPTQEQYLNQINNSYYFNTVAKSAGDFAIYTEEWIVAGDKARDKMSNVIPMEGYNIDKALLAKAGIRSSLYRVLPFQFKRRYEYSAFTFNKCVTSYNNEASLYLAYSHEQEAIMSDVLREKGLSVNEEYGDSCFKFIHVQGMHPWYHLTADTDLSVERVELEECLMGELKLLDDYCRNLDELGLFKDATIIVTADHGEVNILQPDEDKNQNVVPAFFYKPAGVGRNQEMKTSNAPVAHCDIFATVLNAFGHDGSRYGYVLDEISEDMERTRYFTWPHQDPLVTDRESCIHVEYRIEGDARDKANWIETENRFYTNGSPRHPSAK